MSFSFPILDGSRSAYVVQASFEKYEALGEADLSRRSITPPGPASRHALVARPHARNEARTQA
uniref:Uncharacterized protein n=1 Tax=mine drainage metagenome TaxID=410659 RepID=E6PL87_9ZZZZ